MPWPRSLIEWRSASGTRGRRSATKVMRIKRSYKTWFCLTWCRSTGEMPCATLVSHTATPGGRTTTILSISAAKRASGIDIACRRWRTREAPWRQQSINATMAVPTVMGNQPPSTIFSELEARNVASTAENRNHCDCDRGRPSPAPDRHAVEQDGRDQHGAGHGDAVGAG